MENMQYDNLTSKRLKNLMNLPCFTINMSTNDRASDHQNDNSNPDVSNVNRYLSNPKSNCNIGTWNVQTMYNTPNTAYVIKKWEATNWTCRYT